MLPFPMVWTRKGIDIGDIELGRKDSGFVAMWSLYAAFGLR
jgi:hypothetical protein